ncbi:MAG: hypothetical protein AAF492_32240, partial [Verrucomicrobiota bacterium]
MKRCFAPLLLLGSLVAGLHAQDVRNPEEQMRFADALYGRSLYKMALKEYEALLKKAPDYEGKDLVLFR